MLNIIKADLFRIFKGKAIYIIIGIFIINAFISSYALGPLSMGLNLGGEYNEQNYGLNNEQLDEFYSAESLEEMRDILLTNGDYKLDLANVSKNSSLYYIFIALVVIVICCEFSNNTIKNTISSNISKKKYYFSKLVLALLLGTVLLFINTYLCYFVNIVINGSTFSSSISNITILTIKQLPLLWAIISILTMISVITRKTSIYNGITIPLLMVFQLLLLGVVNLLKAPSWILDYELETALSKLCFASTNTYMIQLYSLWIGILVITTLIGYTYFKRRDI